MKTFVNILEDRSRLGNVVAGIQIVPPGSTRVGISIRRKDWSSLGDEKADVLKASVEISEDGIKWQSLSGFTSGPGQLRNRLGNPVDYTTLSTRLPRKLIGKRLYAKAKIEYLSPCAGEVALFFDDAPIPPPPPAKHNSVTYDNDAETTGTGVSSLSFNLTVGNNSLRYLIVGTAAWQDGGVGDYVDTVTYNTDPLALIYEYEGHGEEVVSQWGMAAPDVGENLQVVVTFDGVCTEAGANALSAYNVSQVAPTGTPNDNEGNNDTPTVPIAAAVDDLVFDTVYAYSQYPNPAAGANQTARCIGEITNYGADGSSYILTSTEVGAASVTMSWSLNGGTFWGWSTIGVALKVAPSVTQKTVTDTLSLVDAFPALKVKAALADVLALTDTPFPKLFKSVADNLTLADATNFKTLISILDSLNLADLVRLKNLVSVQDSLTLSDAFPALKAKMTVADALSLAEAITSIGQVVAKLVTDSLTLSDAFPAIKAKMTVADTLAMTDTMYPKLFKGVDDALSLADAASLKNYLAVIDTLSLADAFPLLKIKVTAADTMSLVEAISQKSYLTVADILAVTEAISVITGVISKLVTDSLSLYDTPGIRASLSVADSMLMTDTVYPKLFKSVADSLSLADSIRLKLFKSVTDALSLSDVVVFKNLVSIADSLSLVDAFPLLKAKITVSEPLSLVEVLALKGYLSVADLLTITDTAAKLDARTRVTITDSLYITDLPFLKLPVVITETLTLSDGSPFIIVHLTPQILAGLVTEAELASQLAALRNDLRDELGPRAHAKI